MKAVLVYQAGIANVFEVDTFAQDTRNARRLLQHAFGPCESFTQGLAAAGCEVRSMACNKAGDIINEPWTSDLDSAPFSGSFSPVHACKIPSHHH